MLTVQHVYSLPLYHITSRQFQSEMDGAFVPNARSIVLRPGETVHCPLGIDGLNTIITDFDDHTLIISASPVAFSVVREFAKARDSPIRHLPQPAGSGDKIRKAACRLAPSVPVPPDPGTGEEAYHLFRIPLSHTAPEAVLERLRHSYVPDSGAMVLKAGETVRSSFPLAGVLAILADVPDNSLFIVATSDGFAFVRPSLIALDAPKASSPYIKVLD